MRQVNKFDHCISADFVCLSVRVNEGCWGEGNFSQNFKCFTLLKHCLEAKMHRIFQLCFMLLFERSLMKPMPLCCLGVAFVWMESSGNRCKIALLSSFSSLVKNLFWQNFLKEPLFGGILCLLTIMLICVALLVLGCSVFCQYSALLYLIVWLLILCNWDHIFFLVDLYSP